MTNSPPPDLQGKTIAGRYLVERLIGQGGMGTVWAGRHVTLQQLVAIKFVHPKLAGSAEALRRFDTEAKAAARIKSRHAVAVYDHGVEGGQPYIVMEYLEGESLEQSIARRGKLPLHEVAEIVQQAARALHAAHQAGIVHRDLKPDNIFLARDGEAGSRGYSVKLLDFGIAKLVHEEAASGASSTQAGMVLGTPHYMSPEALTATAPVSAASDIWSLGACAFSAVCGRVPFEGDAIGDVVLKVCAAPLPVPSQLQPSLPKAFDAWFERACSRDPKRRFASVVELSDALVRLDEWARAQREQVMYEIRPMAPSILDTGELEVQPSSKGRLLAGLLVGASLMLGLLGLYVFKRTREADEAVREATARAAAVVEAENQRKLREADKQFWTPDAGSAAQDAGKPAVQRAAPKKKRP
ncbi:MAG TPA: serine/threonine-protein kinase [Polyangiaceae bacterium]|nr:serine/threonine-protein kinase [Polyangiaceae bacterium]